MNAGQRLYPVLKDIVSGRVYQIIRKDGADTQTPYIVYAPITTTPETCIDGYLGHDWSRVQIDVYHDDYDELDSVVDEIIKAINANIQPSELGSRQHLWDDAKELFRQSFDYEFFTNLLPNP